MKNSKEKVGLLENYRKTENIILMHITETWLNKYITDIANIEGYNIYRGDRKEKEHGGTAIYLYNKLKADFICEISHKKCKMAAIKIPDVQTINIVVYRPQKVNLKNLT